MINRKVMYSTALSFAFLLLVAIIFLSLVSIQKISGFPTNHTIGHSGASSFTFGNRTYNFTYVASNISSWQSGLMNKTITNDTFELFIFPDVSVYPFWMKNTYSPLDIVWVNGSTVTYIANATPCSWYSADQSNCTVYNSYNQGYTADYVIEALSGFTNRTGLKVGDKIRINVA